MVPTRASPQDSVRVGGWPGGIAARAPLDARDDIAFRAMAIPDTVWVGQQATYQVGVFLSSEIRARLRRNPVFVPPELRSMLAYDLASLNSVPRYAGGRRYEVHVFQRALFPLTAGRHEIPPARLEYALPLSNSFFAREESHSARTQSLVVIARDPPAAGRPADFRGAVGRLSLQTRVDGRAQRTGDPFTFTAVVLGTGNVSLLPRPDLRVPWADVVPGAVRVQMDSSTTLVRGRKEFDWILTAQRPGRQRIPSLRYPYFNPYTEQYEVALSSPDSLTVTGDPVTVADRSPADSAPVLAIRRRYRGEMPRPVSTAPAFWVLMASAPLPLLLVSIGRVRRPPPATPPEAQLLSAARAGGGDAALVRRIFVRAVTERAELASADLADSHRLRWSLRRAGVSADTAQATAELVEQLNAVVFGRSAPAAPGLAERAVALLRAIDREARVRPPSLVRTAARATSLAALVTLPGLAAWAASQDPISERLFGDGLAAYDTREFGSARQAFFELAQIRPRAADAWYNFATASWQLADTAAAVIGWQRAMRLEPSASDARSRLRLGPGAPRLWHGVPPVSLSTLAVLGGACWLVGMAVLAVSRRRSVRAGTRGGLVFAGAALLILLGGLRQQEILDGRDVSVVVSPARLRAMPVLSSEAGIEAQPGEVARVLGHQGAWTRIELSDRRRGWVEGQRLQALGLEAGLRRVAR